MTDETGDGVLTDAQWAELAPLIEPCRPATKPSTSISAAPSRRSSGDPTTARNGAAFRRIWDHGGWRRRPSTVGAAMAFGSVCCNGRNGAQCGAWIHNKKLRNLNRLMARQNSI